jgi:hypothetical protein
MGFGDAVGHGVEVVRLKRSAYRDVAADPLALAPSLMITALAGVALWLAPPHYPILGILTYPLLSLALLILAVTVLHFVATLLGGRGHFLTLLRVFGVGRVLGWVQIVPFLGSIAQLWSLVISVVAMEELYGLDRSKAVISVLIPAVGLFAFSLVGFLFQLALLGGTMSGGGLF